MQPTHRHWLREGTDLFLGLNIFSTAYSYLYPLLVSQSQMWHEEKGAGTIWRDLASSPTNAQAADAAWLLLNAHLLHAPPAHTKLTSHGSKVRPLLKYFFFEMLPSLLKQA